MAGRKRSSLTDTPGYDGSTPHPNEAHEQVLQYYFEHGFTCPKKEAVLAVLKDIAPDDYVRIANHRHVIFKSPNSRKRLRFLYEQFKSKRISSSKEDILDILLRRASASISDFLSVEKGDDGRYTLEMVPSDIFDGQTIDEIQISNNRYGQTIRVKLPDKEKSLRLVAEIEKMLGDEAGDTVIINQMFESDKAYKKRLERIGGETPEGGGASDGSDSDL